MQQRIGVMIHSDDPVVHGGVVGLLRLRPELVLLPAAGQPQASVLVLCADSVHETAFRMISRSGASPARTVLIVGQIREAELLDALQCGITVVMRRRDASADRVVRAIQLAARGAGDLPPDLVGGLIGHISDRGSGGSGPALASGLSRREIDVIRLVAEGLETREIAAKLCFSERTIKNVLHGMMRRLSLNNRPHAVAYAARAGYLK